MSELAPLPEGQVLGGAIVYNNNGGGLTRTTAEFMAIGEDDSPEFKRQHFANLIASIKAVDVEIFPGEVEAIREYYGF